MPARVPREAGSERHCASAVRLPKIRATMPPPPPPGVVACCGGGLLSRRRHSGRASAAGLVAFSMILRGHAAAGDPSQA